MALCSFAIALIWSVYSFAFQFPVCCTTPLLHCATTENFAIPFVDAEVQFLFTLFQILLTTLMGCFYGQLLSPSHSYHFNLIWKKQHAYFNFLSAQDWCSLQFYGDIFKTDRTRFFFSKRISLLQIIQFNTS